MNSYRQNDRRARRRLLVATVAAALIFLIDLASHGAIRGVVRGVGERVWGAGSGAVSSVETSGVFRTRASLAAENAILISQLAQLQDVAAARAAVEAQNQELRALVHLTQIAPGISAPVISSLSASPYGSFAIGAGSAEGVKPGALVLTADGFAIGRVRSVGVHDALVLELFAPGAHLEVIASGIPLALSGQGGGTADAEAPREAILHVGDTVVAPSLLGRPVGVVGNVKSSAASPSTKVLVRVPANLSALLFVYVETGN